MNVRTCSHPDCENVAAWFDRQSVRHEVNSLATGTNYQAYSSVKTFSMQWFCDEHMELPE